MSETNQHTHHRNECSPDVGLHFRRRWRKHLENNEIDRKLRFKRLHRYFREDCWHRKSSRSLKKRGTNRSERERERRVLGLRSLSAFYLWHQAFSWTDSSSGTLHFFHLLFCSVVLFSENGATKNRIQRQKQPHTGKKKKFFYFFFFFFFRTSWTNNSLTYSLFSMSAQNATGLSPSYFTVRQKSVSSHTNKT